MMEREEIIDRARACKGTPFHLHGRTPGAGLDCLGIVAVAYPVKDRLDYRLADTLETMLAGLEAVGFVRVERTAIPGDLLVFKIGHHGHVAVATDRGMLHVHSGAPPKRPGTCVEHWLTPMWADRLYCVMEWRGMVTDGPTLAECRERFDNTGNFAGGDPAGGE